MLRLYLGRAGSGKTSYIFNELGDLAKERRGGNILIVPEQYSHDCERALASLGDSVCLYAETLSFSRLASRVFSEVGGSAAPMLDPGGRMLAMSMAYMSVAGRLRVYDVGARRPDFVKSLISAYDELRAAGGGTGELEAASEKAGGTLGGKLWDLALIFEAYEAVKERSGMDVRDRLERLADEIGSSRMGSEGRVFLDGFTDFTFQELRVIRELLAKGADVTVSIGAGSLSETDYTFRLQSKTGRTLMDMARRLGQETQILSFSGKEGRSPALRYLESSLMDWSAGEYAGEDAPVTVVRAASRAQECQWAAARCVDIVRAGDRFRDIAVVSPAFSAYSPIIKGVFDKYGVAVAITERSDILDKPVMAFLISALDIIENNWDARSVLKYIKTGFAGISPEDADELENYILKWSVRGESAWTREDGWNMSPEGYGGGEDEKTAAALERVNAARAAVAGPVASLRRAMDSEGTASGYARSVYLFMESTGLYAMLEDKAEALSESGRPELAMEYRQLWDIVSGALGQFCEILGDAPMDRGEFVRLLKLVLGQYTVGVIPSSVDSVRSGDMGRVRARGIRHLIVLGATEDALPGHGDSGGVFSEDERRRLRELGLDAVEDSEDRLSRESALIYNALTVPTDSLAMTYHEGGRKSYIVSRLEKLFRIGESVPGPEIYTAAPGPALELAAGEETGPALEVRRWFEGQERWRGELEALKRAAGMPRGRLTGETAAKLYGGKLRLSASQIDRYYSCRFAYFLRYGLRARPRTEAALDAPEAGTFMHFVLERFSREAKRLGGFRKASWEELEKAIPGIVREYAEQRLGGLQGKSGRFRYLFGRLTKTVTGVAREMFEELRDSDFEPLDFELSFSPKGDLPPVTTRDGDTVVGAVDRVDGWVRDGKLMIRVVDYKTGKKALDLRDVLCGVNLQMLIYLFALERSGPSRYKLETQPAGVLYAPVRDELVKEKHDLGEAELEKEREKLLKYSGLVLADPDVLEAMEHGTKKRLPVKVSSKTGELSGSLASAGQLGKLALTVDRLVTEMAREVHSGSIGANPYLRGGMDSVCQFCDYYEACRFVDGEGGETYRRAPALEKAEIWKKIEEAGEEWERSN